MIMCVWYLYIHVHIRTCTYIYMYVLTCTCIYIQCRQVQILLEGFLEEKEGISGLLVDEECIKLYGKIEEPE